MRQQATRFERTPGAETFRVDGARSAIVVAAEWHDDGTTAVRREPPEAKVP